MLSLLFFACTQATWPTAPAPEPCAAGAIGPGERVLRLDVEGRRRQALVWMPPGEGPHDVVVDLHEYRSEPRRQSHYSRWVEYAPEVNAILVAPDGVSATWNAGVCCGKAVTKQVDDVAFLDALVDRIDAVGCTTGRVLATGIGNGAMMAHRWACESDVPDAVVSVGGALQTGTCSMERPIPVVHLHGDLDRFVPHDGSGGHRPVAEAAQLWRTRNSATEGKVEGQGELSCTTWSGEAPTTFCTVAGMADLWPGARGAEVDSTHPLADATRGGWERVGRAWAKQP